MKRFLIRTIKFYKKYISCLKGGPTCRFTPTCSSYAIEALEKADYVTVSNEENAIAKVISDLEQGILKI